MKRYLIITIDTEGDNLWEIRDIKEEIKTKNARFLPRFQSMCEKYGFIVTYLTNYEMAMDRSYIEFAKDGLKRGKLEIGLHEHAWNTPPYFPLIKSPSYRGKPYLAEYPGFVIKEKLKALTNILEDTFDCSITSHRGGRWCMDERISKALLDLGYIVDCTCTPGVSWLKQPGWSIGSHGTDWSKWECRVDVLYENDKGDRIIEVPTTVLNKKTGVVPVWFRPNGHNLETMIGMIEFLKNSNTDYIEFMLHSSELMPGGSPTFKTEGQIEKLYEDIETVFERLRENGYLGIGLSDYVKLNFGGM